MSCPVTNTAEQDESSFFSHSGLNWDAHRIGWTVSGATSIVTCILTLITVTFHLRNYYLPDEQRQIIRILLMPAVYSIISFCGYRWYREYYYFSFIEVIYEAFVLAAFLMLLLCYIGKSTDEQRIVLRAKDKKKLPLPFCCWRYRPGKPYFLHLLKWGVLQYCLLRPLVSIAGIITEATGKFCPEVYSVHFAAAYLDAVDFISISIALYALIFFYALTRVNLKGRRPLSKFLTIKGIVFVTFYQVSVLVMLMALLLTKHSVVAQGFIFSVLAKHGVIKATTYWTTTNVSNGLQSLATCCEMVIFAACMMFAFNWREYRSLKPNIPGQKKQHTSVIRSFLHSQNYSDFAIEFYGACAFTVRWILGRPGTRASHERGGKFDVTGAFGVHEDGSPHGSHNLEDAGQWPARYSPDMGESRYSIGQRAVERPVDP